ncbi:hypothetical protein A5761_11065 [Mycolicibacterium setense]|uniref:PE domain-containing protein n=1 Tax=Mycolicibacterium setense TaxID=431269 RepID=UPI0007EB80EF|nr:PE domain-containing protein [Mycolicibacterium setense]OBB16992.1 hypothetical protein A5761_11065 [Mycolicibacterium setense]
MASLEVHAEQLLVAARHVAAAAESLSSTAARPLAHPPVAADEVSTSAAARLSEHGMVLSSRASDGAAVLAAAAVAISQAATAYTEMNQNNTQTVSLKGNPGAVSVSFTPAVTANAPDPTVPIAPATPRDGRVTAAVVESGNPCAGSSFITGCADHAAAFRSAAHVVRNAKATVDSALTGQTGPTLTAGLTRFETWANSMADHADTVKSAGQGHSERFSNTQNSTPRTAQFTTLERQISETAALNARPATMGMYTPVLEKLQTRYLNLHTQAGGSMQSYHLAELPAAPPPPPPVVPIVSGEPAATGGTPSASADRATDPQHPGAGPVDEDGLPGADLGGAADDPEIAALLGDPGNGDLPGLEGLPAGAGGAPGGSDPLTTVSMLAGTLPGLLTGVVSGVAAIPAAMAQQAQGAVSQVVEGVSGAVSEFQQSELGASEPSLGLSDFGGSSGLGGGGGGGAGATDPAASSSPLPPGGTGMMSTASTPTPPPPIAGPTTTTTTTAATTSPAGAPMMMPPMGGMGMGAGGAGGGTRRLSEPNKEVYVPPVPNSEPVRGEVVRRRTYQTTPAEPTKPAEKATTVTSARRGKKRVITREEEPQ